MGEARKIHTWKAFIEEMDAIGRINFGAIFTIKELEMFFDTPVGTPKFSFAIIGVRDALLERGMAFTMRDQKGTSYRIAMPEENADEMERFQRHAINSMRRGVILGTSTPLDTLSIEDRRRHEAIVEKMSVRLALINRRTAQLKPPQN